MISENISPLGDFELSYLLNGTLRKDHQYRIDWMKSFFKFHCRKNHLIRPRVLDFGCHDGTILKMIIGKIDADLSGLDHSPEMVKKAKFNKINAKNVDLSYHLPFGNSSKEIIIAGEILEHLYDPGLALRETNRVLIKDGGLIVTVPNICSLRNRLRIIFGKFPMHYHSSASGVWGEHIRMFNFDSLRSLLQKSGFEIRSIASNGMFGSGLLSKIFSHCGDILIVYAIKTKNLFGGKNE